MKATGVVIPRSGTRCRVLETRLGRQNRESATTGHSRNKRGIAIGARKRPITTKCSDFYKEFDLSVL